MTYIETGSRLLLGGALVFGGMHACEKMIEDQPFKKEDVVKCGRIVEKTDKYYICLSEDFGFENPDKSRISLITKNYDGKINTRHRIPEIIYSNDYGNLFIYKISHASIDNNLYVVVSKVEKKFKFFRNRSEAVDFLNSGLK